MSLILFKAPERQADAAPSPDAILRSKTRTNAVYTRIKQDPLQGYFQRLTNPDPTQAKFGGGKGFDLYYGVRRQITELGGIVAQLVDGAMKRKPVIVPGDLADEQSVNVADKMRRIWSDVPEKTVVLRKALDTLVTCGFSPLERVWGRDEQTLMVVPQRLIDRPAQNFVWDVDENPRFLSVLDPFLGEPIDPLKFIFLRDGSLNTPYGESRFTELYSAAWLYQQIRQFMLDAVEKYGRPIPHVLIPRSTDPNDIADIDAFYTAKFGTYTRGMYDGTEIKIEYPSMPVASNGAAGRSEIEVLRFLQGTMYIHLLRTQQTQDKTGGSRALETTRQSITDLAALAYSELLCEGLQEGWMRPSMEINLPSLDRALWPRFMPDMTSSEDTTGLHKRIIDGIDRGVLYSKEWYFKRFGAQEAKDDGDILGHPKATITANTDVPPAEGDPAADDTGDGEP